MLDWQSDYRDDRWQRKRNGILERDSYTCTSCHAEDHRFVEVHHLLYPEPGKRLWEIEDRFLETRCSSCHREVTVERRRLKRRLAHFGGAMEVEMVRRLSGFLAGMRFLWMLSRRPVAVETRGEAWGIAAVTCASLECCEAVQRLVGHEVGPFELVDLADVAAPAGLLSRLLGRAAREETIERLNREAAPSRLQLVPLQEEGGDRPSPELRADPEKEEDG